MKKHIAFLRGINVGNIRIKMTDLKSAFEQMSFKEVQTYLQTGNIVFESEKNSIEIKAILEKGLSETFLYEAFVLVYGFDSLEDIINKYPFTRDENHHDYVIFIGNLSIFDELKNISKELDEVVLFENGVAYWKTAKGESTETAFAKILAKSRYKSNTTTRNINTLKKMV